jgi:purine-binding chemotaxis protein CheW
VTAAVEMVNDMKNKVEDIFSKENNSSLENVTTEKYLTFFINEQLFAIQSSQVVEIIRMQPITFMPKLPSYVKGVINLRGKIVPLIDLRLKLGKAPIEYDEHTSIVVAETSDSNVGFIVDRVNDVTDISKKQISDPPKLAKETATNYVAGIATLEKGVAMLLNVIKLLAENDEYTKSVKEVQQTVDA